MESNASEVVIDDTGPKSNGSTSQTHSAKPATTDPANNSSDSLAIKVDMIDEGE